MFSFQSMHTFFATHLIFIVLITLMTGCETTENENPPELIWEITEVQLSLLESAPLQLDINVVGNTSTAGWTSPHLVATQYLVPPQDGIYEFSFYATPPEENASTVIESISVTHRLNPMPDNLRGVRIIAEQNSIVAMLENSKPPLPEIIHEITKVELLKINEDTDSFEIHAQGLVNGEGWHNPVLIPFEYIQPPQDGVYDFTFYATPPTTVETTDSVAIEVKHSLNALPANFTGVRIHSQTNNIVALLTTQSPPPSPEAIEEITDVTLMILKSLPSQLSITVTGNVSSEGWSQEALVPFQYLVPPQDGIYEFTFTALPPVEPAEPISTPITITHIINPLPDDLKGVRVYSANNHLDKLLEPNEPPPRESQVINEVTEVKLYMLSRAPQQLNILAKGMVTSRGWTSPTLVPNLTNESPQNGIYDFTFYALPPEQTGDPASVRLETTLQINPVPDDLVGVRIHAQTNDMAVLLNTLPPPSPSEIILSITQVEIAPVPNVPGSFDIHVEGEVFSGGWTNPLLIPVNYIVPPQDGIYDFTFYATKPNGPASSVILPINVVHRISIPPSDMAGVRVHSDTNNKEALLPR